MGPRNCTSECLSNKKKKRSERQVVAMGEGRLRQVARESVIGWEEVTSEPLRH